MTVNAEAAALVRSFKVGTRTVTLTMQQPKTGTVTMMPVEWDPNMPRELSEAEWKQYRKGRDAAVTEYAERMGIKIVVAEI